MVVNWKGVWTKIEEHAAVVLPVVFSLGFGAGCGYMSLKQDISDQRTLQEAIDTHLEKIKYTEELYRQLPKDIDFLIRTLTISLDKESSIKITDPLKEGFLDIKVTNIKKVSKRTWKSSFIVSGSVWGNRYMNNSWEVDIEQNKMSGPFRIYPYAFYIYVSNIYPDGEVELSLARRVGDSPSKTKVWMLDSVFISHKNVDVGPSSKKSIPENIVIN